MNSEPLKNFNQNFNLQISDERTDQRRQNL